MKRTIVLLAASFTLSTAALAGGGGKDTNGDGQISEAEFSASKAAWWTRADADGNGAVSKTELATAEGGGR